MRFGDIPHPIPYQGSKRQLAPLILSFIPTGKFNALLEPFVGSGAVTLATAKKGLCKRFIIGDSLEPLCGIWQQIVNEPLTLSEQYAQIWHDQFPDPIAFFNGVRQQFNLDRSASKLLFLLARCVKNAVRFNPAGHFNQSPDNRRTGTRPHLMKAELFAAHRILAGRCQAVHADFLSLFQRAQAGEIFYLDPPYQGTSEGRDRRYVAGVSRDRMMEALTILNEKRIPFILSYDGSCGERQYGDPLSSTVAHRILLDVGRSSQATLNGRDDVTMESLYVSHFIPDLNN